jgi:hypothetical protein
MPQRYVNPSTLWHCCMEFTNEDMSNCERFYLPVTVFVQSLPGCCEPSGQPHIVAALQMELS